MTDGPYRLNDGMGALISPAAPFKPSHLDAYSRRALSIRPLETPRRRGNNSITNRNPPQISSIPPGPRLSVCCLVLTNLKGEIKDE